MSSYREQRARLDESVAELRHALLVELLRLAWFADRSLGRIRLRAPWRAR